MCAVDRVDRVVDRGVDDREVAGRLDVRRLRAGRVHDREQELVPVDHRLSGLLRPGVPCRAAVAARVCSWGAGVGAGGEDGGCAESAECESERE